MPSPCHGPQPARILSHRAPKPIPPSGCVSGSTTCPTAKLYLSPRSTRVSKSSAGCPAPPRKQLRRWRAVTATTDHATRELLRRGCGRTAPRRRNGTRPRLGRTTRRATGEDRPGTGAERMAERVEVLVSRLKTERRVAVGDQQECVCLDTQREGRAPERGNATGLTRLTACHTSRVWAGAEALVWGRRCNRLELSVDPPPYRWGVPGVLGSCLQMCSELIGERLS